MERGRVARNIYSYPDRGDELVRRILADYPALFQAELLYPEVPA